MATTIPTVYLPELISVRPQYTSSPDTSETPQNIMWFKSASSGTPTLGNLATISGVFDNAWATVWKDAGTASASYKGSIVQDYSSATGLEYSSVGVFTPVPGVEGSPFPENAAILISWQIPLRWRGGHFRTYLPWVGQNACQTTDANKLTSGIITTMNTNIQTLIANMNASGVLGGQQLVMFKGRRTSPFTGGLYPVSTFTVNQLLASQRRRLRKVTRK